jgi:hypothetical protein
MTPALGWGQVMAMVMTLAMELELVSTLVLGSKKVQESAAVWDSGLSSATAKESGSVKARD